MTAAAFLFFYLIAAILAMQKPVLIIYGFGIYFGFVVRSVWLSSNR